MATFEKSHRAMVMAHTRATNPGQKSVGSTDRQTDTTDRIIFRANTVTAKSEEWREISENDSNALR